MANSIASDYELSDYEFVFLETTADTDLFHCISAHMTAELRDNGHDQPERLLTPHALQDAYAIFLVHKLSVQGMIAVSYHADSGLARLYRHWVVPSARGMGIGRALMMHAERFVAGRGCRTIVLDTSAERASAVALYRSMDYIEVPSPKRSPGDLLFRKYLTGSQIPTCATGDYTVDVKRKSIACRLAYGLKIAY